jgi:hypothetical protein
MKRMADAGGGEKTSGGGLERDRAPAIYLHDHRSGRQILGARRAVGCAPGAGRADRRHLLPLQRSSRSACEWESQLENETDVQITRPAPGPLVTPFQIRRFCAGSSVMALSVSAPGWPVRGADRRAGGATERGEGPDVREMRDAVAPVAPGIFVSVSD